MKPMEVRIGETYRIKSREDLAAEFGIIQEPNGLVYIGTPIPLPANYWRICGNQFTVRQMERLGEKHQSATLCLSYEGVEILRRGGGSVSVIAVTSEMLEELPTPEISEIPPESLLDFLFG